MKVQKIVIIGTRGIPAKYGGFETCVDEVSRRLVDSGMDVTVYCRKSNVGDSGESYCGVKLIKLPSIRRKSLDTLSHTFASVIHALPRGYDIFHIYGLGNAIFVPLLKLFRKQVVVSVDGIEWKRKKWGRFAKLWFKVAEYMAVRFANEIIADSRVVQDYYREKLRRTPRFIPYGAYAGKRESQEFLKKIGLEKDGYLLFVGRLIPEKGVHYLIEAFEGIETEKKLVIVGDDPYNREYIESLKKMADERVMFPGYVYNDDYAELCSHAYLYIQPSELEGTSPALLAAMGFGNCVVVNGIPENLETVGDSGISYPVNDVDELRKTIQYLIEHPDEVAFYQGLAEKRVKDHYNWDRIATACKDLYEELNPMRRTERDPDNRPKREEERRGD